MSETEALDLLDKCLKVLYYRDARSLNKVHFSWRLLKSCIASKGLFTPSERERENCL